MLLLVLASGASAQDIGQPGRGRAAALRLCSDCHAVERGTLSPMFNAPAFELVANTPGMNATALSAALQTSHRTMPNLVLEPGDFSDVIAYILSLQR
jgi:mono/diheme cytochrome c family protein